MGLDLKDLNLNQYYHCWFKSGLRYILHTDNQPDTNNRTNSNPATKLDFPEPWESVLKTTNPPVPIVLTYYQLPEDLGNSHMFDNNRIQLFQNILKALNWPKENRAFLPATRIVDNDLQEEPDIFWKIIQILNPAYLICFGEPVFKMLFPDKSLVFDQFEIENDLDVLFVPGPDDMLPDNREAKKRVWNFLKDLKST